MVLGALFRLLPYFFPSDLSTFLISPLPSLQCDPFSDPPPLARTPTRLPSSPCALFFFPRCFIFDRPLPSPSSDSLPIQSPQETNFSPPPPTPMSSIFFSFSLSERDDLFFRALNTPCSFQNYTQMCVRCPGPPPSPFPYPLVYFLPPPSSPPKCCVISIHTLISDNFYSSYLTLAHTHRLFILSFLPPPKLFLSTLFSKESSHIKV